MKRALLPLLLATLLLAPAGSGAREIYGKSAGQIDFYQGNKLLQSWRVPEARALADKMKASGDQPVAAAMLDAHVKFFEGRYEEAKATLEGLGAEGSFSELVRATAEATRGFTWRESKHFIVGWADPKDEILADSALAGMETARRVLSDTLGFAPEGKVRVEIYPTSADFTAVSTLTRDEVETSGTIGLCKFDRVMITSPRATFFGYRWRDTLCHEYVHLAVYRMSEGQAPIWMHEGIAKHLEGAWRGVVGAMDAQSLALLAERHTAGTLIPLEKMSPSVAKLPSATETALAFAEVGTMMRFLTDARGPGSIPAMVRAVGAGQSDRAALEKVWKGSFDSFYQAWDQWVGALPPPPEGVEVRGPKLRDEGVEPVDDPGAIPDPEARDFARLGDMLRGRGRMEAAAVEYRKGYAAAPKNPAIVSRHAMGRLYLEEPAEALRAVEGVIGLYADRGVLWSRKGEALFALERYKEAIGAFDELMEINPFDLPGRMGLLAAAEAAGDAALAERERNILKILGADAVPEGHPGKER